MTFNHFDREEFIRQTAGNEDIAREVAVLYRRDIQKELNLMDEAHGRSDMEAVRRLAHKSKSGFIIMGANSLYEKALYIEKRAKEGAQDLKAELTDFRHCCEELDKELLHSFQLNS